MYWEFETTTTQVARKEYNCEAAEWILNYGLDAFDFTEEEKATLDKAKAENWKILKGTEYIKTSGKWDGEFSEFKARIDLNAICQKYDMYQY